MGHHHIQLFLLCSKDKMKIEEMNINNTSHFLSSSSSFYQAYDIYVGERQKIKLAIKYPLQIFYNIISNMDKQVNK